MPAARLRLAARSGFPARRPPGNAAQLRLRLAELGRGFATAWPGILRAFGHADCRGTALALTGYLHFEATARVPELMGSILRHRAAMVKTLQGYADDATGRAEVR